MTEQQAREIYKKFTELRDIMEDQEGGCVHNKYDDTICWQCEENILVSLLCA